tara:strand:+ start:37 stop:183 length:147 start_codon:yes stop_codon:yes gene_type:complete
MFIDPPPPKPRPMPIRSSVEMNAGNSIISWFFKKVEQVKEVFKKEGSI